MGRGRRGSGPRAMPRTSAGRPGSEVGEPPGARGAAGADKEPGASSRPHRPSPSPTPPLRKRGRSGGQRGGWVHFSYSSREPGRRVFLSEAFTSRTEIPGPRDPRQDPRTPPARAPQRPFRRDLSSGLRLARREVRAKELGARGRARAGGGARGRRSGGDTCGGAGGAGLGARGFKKVWRGAGAFPGLAEGRCAEAVAAAARRGWDDALSAPTDPAPLQRGPKKLWEPGSPAELPCGASLPSPLRSPPPPSRLPSAWLLRPGASQTE